MTGILTLIPTPIDEENPLGVVAQKILLEATSDLDRNIFVIEDLKPGRRRWLKFGLPREVVEQFVLYNEHTYKDAVKHLLQELRSGKNVFLMSDGGLPAFCDPGIDLVRLCHQENIRVTSTPFDNSIALAVALSGISHQKFMFEGFLSLDDQIRQKEIAQICQRSISTVVMDTPYRLKKLLTELVNAKCQQEIFVAMDLNSSKEELCFGRADQLLSRIVDFKREFVMVIAPKL